MEVLNTKLVLFIIHGFRQRYGEDYWETYAPVTSNRAIKARLAIAASNGMMIHQMDIDPPFLNPTLDEDMYMLPLKVLIYRKEIFTVEEESIWTEAISKEFQQDP